MIEQQDESGHSETAIESAEESSEGKKEVKGKSSASKGVKAMTKEDIINAVKGMTVLELAELVKDLEKEFGVSAAAPVAMAMAPMAGMSASAGGAASTEEEEKVEFTVILKTIGENKISVIKAVREVTTLGLKEAKDLVESAPKPVAEGINKEEADNIKKKLEEAGAVIEVK